MRASVHARLGASFHPGPADGAAFVARPRLPLKDARRRRLVKMPLVARHSSSAGVPRHFGDIGRTFAVRTIGPWARQLTVLVAVFGAGLHSSCACYRDCASTYHEFGLKFDLQPKLTGTLIEIRPLKPAEFVVLKIQQMAGQIQT